MKRCLKCDASFSRESWTCPNCGASPPRRNGFVTFAPELDSTSEGFDPDTFDELHSLEELSFWFRSRNELISWAIGQYFPSARSFLEIGCGTGFVLANIEANHPELSCAGSEIHSSGLEFAKTRVSQAELWQMDARQIPFVEEFGLIGAFDVLEHISEDVTALDQIYQAVRPGGGVLLTVPQHPWLWSEADEQAHHQRRYTRNDLQEKLMATGFEVARITSFVSLLLPIMAASRLKNKLLGSKTPVAGEMRLPGFLDTTLESIMRFEKRLIRSGVNFPFGGSLLVAASKPKQGNGGG